MYYWQGPERKLSFRKVAYSVLICYLLIACYYGVHKLQLSLKTSTKSKDARPKSISITDVVDDPDWNPWGEEFESEIQAIQHHQPPELWQQQPVQQEVNDQQGQALESHAFKSMEIPQRSHRDPGRRVRDLVTRKPRPALSQDNSFHIVEVWGKAAIGLYLWQHIFDADLEDRLNGVWRYGEKTVGSIKFRFRTGPGVIPGKVPRETEHLLLVINGREPSAINRGKEWLDSLKTFPRLQNVAVVMLGSETCDNSWFHPYLAAHGGLVKALFVVYDSPEVDNINIFQWPLGVATYRDFPAIQNSDFYLDKDRRYIFNFLGTIYPNSSRETLLTEVEKSPHSNLGYVRARAEWQPGETPESREQYLYALSNSHLTLNPVGINTECYRIYEAMAMGSIPVIEDVMTPGYCGKTWTQKNLSDTLSIGNIDQESRGAKGSQYLRSILRVASKDRFLPHVPQPLRLLKEFDAPVIYLKDWKKDLQDILRKEAAMSSADRTARRQAVLRWYAGFLSKMQARLVSVLKDKFFHRPVV